MAAGAFVPVTDADLERARKDPAFRQQLVARSLDHLIVALNRLRSASSKIDTARALQIREGAQLAVKLADILHRLSGQKANSRVA